MFLRKFIILTKKSEQNAKGHAKLEVRGTRGKVLLNVEGLKVNLDQKDVYKTYLVSNEKSGFKKVDIGTIKTTKDGRGILDSEFNPTSVGGTNIGISDFNIILIKLETNSEGKVEVPLGGYIHTDDKTVQKAINTLQSQITKEVKEITQQTIEPKEEKVNQDKQISEQTSQNVEVKHERPMLKKENESEFIQELQDYLIDKKIINSEDLEEEQEVETIKETQALEKEVEDKVEESIESESQDSKSESIYEEDMFTSYSDHIAKYTLNILKFFDKVSPLKKELEGYTWWEIEYDKKNIHRGFLPYYNYLINMYYPYTCITKYSTCQNQIRKNGHYIFGTIEQDTKVRYYIYGVPGEFTKEEQPYGGKTGFVTWFEKKDQEDKQGYWIIYIDALTGNIVRPL